MPIASLRKCSSDALDPMAFAKFTRTRCVEYILYFLSICNSNYFTYLNNFESALSKLLVICFCKFLSWFAEYFLYSSKNFFRMKFLLACRFWLSRLRARILSSFRGAGNACLRNWMDRSVYASCISHSINSSIVICVPPFSLGVGAPLFGKNNFLHEIPLWCGPPNFPKQF